MLCVKPAFSLYTFTLIKRLFSYSLLSGIKEISYAYLRLLILTILIPACDSLSQAFPMMYSAYKLNKQGDNIQPCHTCFPISNQSVVPCPVLLLLDVDTGFSGDRKDDLPFASLKGFPLAQLVKNHLECERPGFDTWVGKIPWRRERLPTPIFWPGEFHGLYSPWGHKESDMTEQLSLSLSKIFSQFVVIHTVNGFIIGHEAEVDVFLEFLCFLCDPMNVGNLISGSSAFSKSSLSTWKFSVHILPEPSLKDFEHNLTSM